MLRSFLEQYLKSLLGDATNRAHLAQIEIEGHTNDNGTFALLDNSLLIDPAGPGVSALADTIQNVTIVATQSDGNAAPLKRRR